jgi:hypothetical protein
MKLSGTLLRRHVDLARKRVRELEETAKEQRALVEEMGRNGWISGPAANALAETEAALIDRRKHLDFLLQNALDKSNT